ncbi:MAG: beta-lactamase family protein [Bacteroidales bacterium]|jgi:CubicO group peptidase (beta-lactamase class C family)|nr:beta-lactamase family protein [Bacteroidales bacterium]
MKKILFLVISLFLVTFSFAQPQRLDMSTPAQMGMDPVRLSRVDQAINQAINDTIIPGAVIAVVRKNKIVYLKAYGYKSIYPKKEKMTTDVVFDLASCSKPVGTATSIMQLVEAGQLRLTDKVSMYVPGFQPYTDSTTGEKTDVRIIDLLTHSSGLPDYVNPSVIYAKYGNYNPESLIDWIAHCKKDFKPATKFRYSCLNFITLQNVLQNITKQSLCDYAQRNVFDKLGMEHTTYSPAAQKKDEIMRLVAPTEKQPDGSVLLGVVHDPLARLIGKGNSGNAGVFSSAEDLALFAAAMMNGGEYGGRRILGDMTVKIMTTVPSGVKNLGRSLGWDNWSDYSSNLGNLFTPEVTYGHTGYTGTSIVIDPESKTAVILLANRVHPYDTGSVVRTRALVANIVAGSIVKEVK